jgi:hypothetical protein
MNARTWSVAAALVFVADGSLSTDYSHDRAVRVETSSEVRMESSTSFEREGAPQEMTSSSTQKRHLVHVDHVLEHDGNAPKKVRRHFIELKQDATMTFGDQDRSDDREGSLVDVTLDLTRDGDDVKVEVVEGKKPASEALEGHKLELALDALLPEKDVKAGGEWEVESAGVRRALGIDLGQVLFPPPQQESSGQGGDRGRGRGRGGFSPTSMVMQVAEWECKAKLKDGDEEFEGAACAAIELTITAKGSVPEQEGGSGGGRMFGEARGARPENSFEIALEGTLLFDRAQHLPVHLELNGKLTTESHTERTWQDNKVKIDSKSEGELAYEVSVRPEKSE